MRSIRNLFAAGAIAVSALALSAQAYAAGRWPRRLQGRRGAGGGGGIAGMMRAAAIALLFSAAPALACGFEDPSNVAFQRGILNFAFPKALWVQTAVWQAQEAGLLERDQSLAGNRALLGFRRASDALSDVARQLDARNEKVPPFALVMIGPVLWTRFAEGEQGLSATPHVNGPSSGDVVLVSDEPVILALAKGRIGGGTALEHGLIRIYGEPAKAAMLESMLRRIGG